MQLLNKRYIKAAHSAGCTIAELGRGMDYSDNGRGGSRLGARDLLYYHKLIQKGER